LKPANTKVQGTPTREQFLEPHTANIIEQARVPLIPNGQAALFHYVGSLPASTRFEYQHAFAEGDFIMVYGRYSDNGYRSLRLWSIFSA
jgi:hypothetical protein